MTDPRQPPSTPEAPEPGTARALWPTFMRRTLPVEDVADASPEPDRRRPDEPSAEKTLGV
jgi:hypothetical protein